jgi:DNA-binding CsgD family transcriptional regulator/tetratricopeptide (TPR) repeat protein
MRIVERGRFLEELNESLAAAVAGAGSVALVSGEAGIGKTTLVDAFEARATERGVRSLRGSCDALHTPRPLGPLLDIALAAGGRLRGVVERGAEREELFASLLDDLRRPATPTLVIFEDVHWADEATLDLLKFLGRRVGQTRALLVVTFRDDALPPRHPLRGVFADLPRAAVRRFTLPRLSEAAVEELAREAGRPAAGLYALTSGNPFFVTEVLAGEGGVPVSVRDAIFARAAKLDGGAREVLDAVSLVPGRMERWLLEALVGPAHTAVEACLAAGVLEAHGRHLGFRHELARLAWEGSVDGERARTLHGRVLTELLARYDAVSAARLVHHAEGADDRATLLRLAPVAAREAVRLGAHREAAAHYEMVLESAAELPRGERAELLEEYAIQAYLTGAGERAVAALEEALAIRRELGDRRRQSEDLRWLARLAWFRGEEETVRRYAREAVDVVVAEGPSPELAMAYSTLSQMRMCAEDTAAAIEWGESALALARELGHEDTLMHAQINVGSARLMRGEDEGRAQLEQTLRLARERGAYDHAARALVNLAEIAVDWRDVERAGGYLEDAIRFCTDRDMDPYALCVIGARATFRLLRGEWAAAIEDAERVLRHPRVPPVDRIPALVTLALIRARRGDPSVWPLLDEARALAEPTGELHRIGIVAAARAEAAWLDGRLRDTATEARPGYELARERENPWALGELAVWLGRTGESVPGEIVAASAEPYALELSGEEPSAAVVWSELGFPFKRALTLARSEDPADAHEALRILHELGARRAAEVVVGELRGRGLRSLPRGPRPGTRGNPAQLTRRQLGVLALVAEGLTNAEIAERLFITPKTVEHHVSAILDKLDVRSRVEAAVRARELGAQPAGPGAASQVPFPG